MTLFAVLLSLFCDLATAAPASKDGLQLSLTVRGGAIRGGAQQLHVSAELKNIGARPLRVAWRPSGAQPLALIVDGETHALPPGIATAALLGWVELAPGESVREDRMEIFAVSTRHRLSWHYTVDKGPYGRPLANCWTGTLTTAPVEVAVPR